MEVVDHIPIVLEMFPMDVERREISFLFDSVNTFQLIQVVELYNQHKPLYWNCLELLNRSEIGFKIACDANNIYNEKQLRWHNKRLVPHVNSADFTCDETLLLYKALCHVFGKRLVILQDFY
uniref:Uncharacterized protein n=1 Tax=viral metagenome TaxID=1070528 RepID=A0A6C0E2Y7_9ZZZZ